VQLGLGTVQFGLPYGVAGRGEPVPEAEIQRILAIAHANGIRLLDTAAAYGDIEERLVPLCGGRQFRIVSKIAPIAADSDDQHAAECVKQSIRRSQERLGDALTAVLFHRARDLLDRTSAATWFAASRQLDGTQIRLGVSCYDPGELRQVRERCPVQVAQLPSNAFDQAVRGAPDAIAGVEVHVRSVFLQGLLLMSAAEAQARVPAAAERVVAWHRWCQRQGLEPVRAALGAAKSMVGVHYVIVGVDRPAQIESILAAWQSAPVLDARELACEEPDVIDPRRWKVS
jgi:hypothetical protein